MKNKVINILVIAGFLVISPLIVRAQNVEISSIVVDEYGQPMANSTVTTQNGEFTTETNEFGEFVIEIPETSKLIVQKKGYQDIIINIANATQPIVIESTGMNQRVNIPFGQKRSKNITGAVAVLEPDEIAEFNNIQQAIDVISARTLGVLNNNNIRGLGEALIVVDGIPRLAEDLNLEEVEQITVLKDVNASILYGTMARNGVIMITTKRGKANRNVMNAYAERGISTTARLPQYLGSADYMRMRNIALRNDGLPIQYPDSVIGNYANGTNPYRYPSVDYYSSEFMKQSLNFTRIVTEFSGGNDNTQYYAHMGWNNTGSLFTTGEGVNAGTNRFNLRANVDYKITDYIRGKTDGVFVLNVDRNPIGDFWEDAATLQPQFYAPLIPTSFINDESILETAERVNGDFLLGGTSQFQNNVYGNMLLGGKRQDFRRTVQFNNRIDFDLTNLVEGLAFKTNLSMDIYNTYQQRVSDEYAVYEVDWQTATSGQDSISSVNRIGRDLINGVQRLDSAAFIRRVGFYGLFDYNRSFGDHDISGTLLGFYNSNDAEGYVVAEKQMHAGLRLAYSYKNKYFVDFSSTLANSQKLREGNRAGFSPSLGVAWVLSEEAFMSNSSLFDYLKLRASAGIIKTDVNFGLYLYETTLLGESGFSWNDDAYSNSTTFVSRSANPNLGFEQMSNINFGVEGAILDNALDFNANVFYNKHSNIVTRRDNAYPGYIGPNYPHENFAANEYTGAELALNWRAFSAGDFSLSIGGNVLYMQSKVLIEDEVWANDYQYRAGNQLESIFGLEAMGLFQDSTEILNSPAQYFGQVKPGDIKYKDQNNDGVIDQNDEVVIGQERPNLSYGINLMLKYKSFSLFALGRGTAGDNRIFRNDYFWVDGNEKYSEEVLNSWTPENRNGTYPRLTTGNSNNNYRTSTYWLTNNAMFNLSHVQLTYDVPNGFLSKLGMKNTNIYLRGQNLFTIAENVEKRELNIQSMPQLRNFALGVRAFF